MNLHWLAMWKFSMNIEIDIITDLVCVGFGRPPLEITSLPTTMWPVQMTGVLATRAALSQASFIDLLVHVSLDNEFTSFLLPPKHSILILFHHLSHTYIPLLPAKVMFESWFQLKAILWKNWLQKRAHIISKLTSWFKFAFDRSYGSLIQAFWLRSCCQSSLWSSWSWSSLSPQNISRQM